MHHHPFVNIAIEAAVSAGKNALRHFDRIDQLKIEEKNKNDYVTEADLAAEQIIIHTIKTAYPHHAILAEESGDNQSGSQSDHHSESEVQWIIDPIDGTLNFMHGFPHFAISIGIKIGGKLEHGVIFDPIRQEIFCATRGRGAYLNNRRIRVSAQSQLMNSFISTTFPYLNSAQVYQDYLKMFGACLPACSRMRNTGSAALDLAYVASGRLDAYWGYGLKSWDLAAGIVLVQEAGGLLSDFTGGDKYLTTGNIVATTPKILKGLLQTLSSVVPENWK